MTLEEIKQAVVNGHEVCWKQTNYQVRHYQNSNKRSLKSSDFIIICTTNNNCIGLTWQDNITLNGDKEDFFINKKEFDSI